MEPLHSSTRPAYHTQQSQYNDAPQQQKPMAPIQPLPTSSTRMVIQHADPTNQQRLATAHNLIKKLTESPEIQQLGKLEQELYSAIDLNKKLKDSFEKTNNLSIFILEPIPTTSLQALDTYITNDPRRCTDFDNSNIIHLNTLAQHLITIKNFYYQNAKMLTHLKTKYSVENSKIIDCFFEKDGDTRIKPIIFCPATPSPAKTPDNQNPPQS